MNTEILAEKKLQKDVISLLTNMGYTYIDETKNQILRNGRLSTVIFTDILKSQLEKINAYTYRGEPHTFSAKNINQALRDIEVPLNEGLASANAEITDMLLLGKAYEETQYDGVKKSFSLRFIDVERPQNNVFHVTEEFVVNRIETNEKEKTRRPDLVLFVNGIPFAVIELKKSSVNIDEGISQMLRNQNEKEIPHLFRFTQILVAGNNYEARYATANTPLKFWAVWKEEEAFESRLNKLVHERMITTLDRTLYSLFEKNRALELVSSFTLFDNKIKKIARYQQYFAIKSAMDEVQKLDNIGNRKGGLIWHTQGSGKSLTMVMLAKMLIRQIVSAKVIVVTDRIDLDKQIHETFRNSEIDAKKARHGRELLGFLQQGKTVITTVINKFIKAMDERVSFEDRNVFILVDESHRTQSGLLHKAMKKVFPNACYLGFTGTPLMKKEKSSFAKFGGEIHRYTIDQAVEDGAVLPLLYEGRLVEQWVNDDVGLDRKFELIAKNLGDEQRNDLKRKWARFQKVASSERRLEGIVLDINEHFTHNLQHTGFKAMLATGSKYEAIKCQKIFEEYGDIKTAYVISAPDSREGYTEVDEDNKQFIHNEWNKIIKAYGTEEKYVDWVKDEFIEGEEVELLIVVDKLLTGFDAPRASVLYIDKELKDHNLLQAIARVNRLYDGKDFGKIIDYRGLLGNLDKALSSYSSLGNFDEEDITGAVIDIKEEIAKVKTYYSTLVDLFKDVENKNDRESYEVYLRDEEVRDSFYELLQKYSSALNLALGSEKIEEILCEEEIVQYRQALKFYNELRKSVGIRYHERVDFSVYEKQMQKLLDTYISAGETNEVIPPVNIFDVEFESVVESVVGERARADTIRSAMTATITEKREENPDFYNKLSKRIEEILQAYKEHRLSDEEYLKLIKETRRTLESKTLDDAKAYPAVIQSNTFAKIVYDNLQNDFAHIANNVYADRVAAPPLQYGDTTSEAEPEASVLAEFSRRCDEIYKEVSKKPDWKHNSEMSKKIDGEIEALLWDLEDRFGITIETDKIIEVVKKLGINNYD